MVMLNWQFNSAKRHHEVKNPHNNADFLISPAEKFAESLYFFKFSILELPYNYFFFFFTRLFNAASEADCLLSKM